MNGALKMVLAWLPSVAYMVGIWILSSTPLPLQLEDFPLKDKGAHFLEYAVLGLLNAHAITHTGAGVSRGRAVLYAALLTAAFGYADEIHQAFVPGRSPDVVDLFADSLGALAGACVYLFTPRRQLRAESRRSSESSRSG